MCPVFLVSTKDVVTLALWLLWPFAGLYFGLCVWIPEIRPYWRNGYRFGLFSCIGGTVALGVTWLLHVAFITGLVRDWFLGFLYPIGLLGILIAMVGGWIEAADEESNRKRLERLFKKHR